jgi:hypothetical protein
VKRRRTPYRLPSITTSNRLKHAGPQVNSVTIAQQWLSRAETVGKVLVFITASLYVLGLLSVNGYLLQLGVSDFSLVRVRFIYTGFLIAFVFIISYFLPLIMYRGGRSIAAAVLLHKRSLWVRAVDYVAAAILAAWGLLIAALGVSTAMSASQLGDSDRTSSNFLIGGVVVIAAFVLGVAVHGAMRFNSRINRRVFKSGVPSAVQHTDVVMTSMLAACLAALYLLIFLTVAYPSIPVQFGGGASQRSRLVFKDEFSKGARELGIPVTNNGRVTEPIEVLYEGSEGYVIRVNDQIMQVKKDQIAAVAVKTP